MSPSAIPSVGRIPEPQEIVARVEVRDAESEVYIPGADVSVAYPGGEVSKRTDAGGNASFSRRDFGQLTPDVLRGSIYRVEKPGYQAAEKPFAEGQITSFSLPRAAKGVSQETAAAFPTTTALAVGGIAALAVVAFLALR